jgi:hypothetical protein
LCLWRRLLARAGPVIPLPLVGGGPILGKAGEAALLLGLGLLRGRLLGWSRLRLPFSRTGAAFMSATLRTVIVLALGHGRRATERNGDN